MYAGETKIWHLGHSFDEVIGGLASGRMYVILENIWSLKEHAMSTKNFTCPLKEHILGLMQTLAERIRILRGNRTVVDFADATGVSRGALKDAEDGKSIRLCTLEKIARACSVDANGWISLLISWIRVEVGDKDFRKLDIRPALPDNSQAANFAATLELLFRQLSAAEQTEIFKAITRTPVRQCLPAINRLYEERGAPSPLREAFQSAIDAEDVTRFLQKLEAGDESVFVSGSKEPLPVESRLTDSPPHRRTAKGKGN